MNVNNCTVKDMLNQGIDPQVLLDNLQREIAEAQAQIAAEQTSTQEINEIRTELADLFIDYIEALRILPAEVMDEVTTEDVVELLKELEDQIKASFKMAHLFNNFKKQEPVIVNKVNIDNKIINDFLKSLK